MSDFVISGVPLDDIHAVQLEMLDEIDRICRENNIKYFLRSMAHFFFNLGRHNIHGGG